MAPKVVIVGAGISGLAIAESIERHSAAAGRPIRPVILEAEPEAGGKITSHKEQGFVIDSGPHGFLDKEPKMFELIERLGLSDRVIGANKEAENRFIVRQGRLRKLPSSPPAFLAGDVLPLLGKLRVLWEPFAKGRPDAEESVWQFAARRIGKPAADVLIDAMVTGIYGGDPKKLSLPAAFPRMFELETQYGSLIKAQLAIAKQKKKALPAGASAPKGGAGGPTGTLHSFQEGLGELTRALASRAEVRPKMNLAQLGREGSGFRLRGPGLDQAADRVVLAIPAFEAERLLLPHAEAPARTLGQIPYASIAVLVAGYRASALPRPLDGFGFLIPNGEARSILGTIWASSVFPIHVPEGAIMLRTMIGGERRAELLEKSDDELIQLSRAELAQWVGLDPKAEPLVEKVIRWPRGIPQYSLGHATRVAAADALEAALPGLYLAGNALRGVAMLNCVADADRVGARVVAETLAQG